MLELEYSCDYTVAFDFFKLSEFDEMKKICVPVLASREGNKPQGIFIRSLDAKAAQDAFSEFLQGGSLKADQRHSYRLSFHTCTIDSSCCLKHLFQIRMIKV